MSQPQEGYQFFLDDKYGKSTVIDVPAEVESRAGDWFNQTLTLVNDMAVRLSVLIGEHHWHKHDDADEFFFVLEGQLHLDIEGEGTIVLEPHQGYTVPKGVVHRSTAPAKTVMIMVEAGAAAPAGD